MKKSIIIAAFALASAPFVSMAAPIGTPVQATTTVTFTSGQVTSNTLTSVMNLGSGPLASNLIIAEGTARSDAPNIGFAFNAPSTSPDLATIDGNSDPGNQISVKLTAFDGVRQPIDTGYAIFDNGLGWVDYLVQLDGDQLVTADTYNITVNAVGWEI